MDGLVARTDYPLYVITTADAGAPSGCLAGFVTQCSIDPPHLLVCVSRANHTFAVARSAAGLAVHLLGADQADLARVFGGLTGDTVDKFSRCAWRTGETGVPVLEECAAWAEGRTLQRIDVGDHTAFVIEPVAGGTGTHPGQLTYKTAPDLDPGHPADEA
jgi:flavin reductase (DIM6/NTAB) family NADH-FMN oxidoreductase RutF